MKDTLERSRHEGDNITTMTEELKKVRWQNDVNLGSLVVEQER